LFKKLIFIFILFQNRYDFFKKSYLPYILLRIEILDLYPKIFL
jgi:hypothetical protein